MRWPAPAWPRPIASRTRARGTTRWMRSARRMAEALDRRGPGRREGQAGLPRPGGGRRPQRHPRHRHAHRRPRHHDGAADHRRGRRSAARARLRAVHPRRDAGVLRRHARHRAGRADHRRARGRVPRALHAALQFPALFGGRGRPHGLARAAARSATASWPGARSIRCCRRRRSSPTRCGWSRRSPNPTASPRWRRCAAARSR